MNILLIISGFFILIVVTPSTYSQMPGSIPLRRRNSRVPVSRILGGVDAKIGEVKSMAALGFADKFGNFSLCGASIISCDLLLTAAHCFNDQERATILLGTTNTYNYDLTTNVIEVNKTAFISHPDYNRTSIENDIGLIRIPKIEFNDVIQPIQIICDKYASSDYLINKTTKVCGWGLTSDVKESSKTLQCTSVQIVPEAKCAEVYGTTVTSKNICQSGLELKGSCSGDSGGPLMIEGCDNKQQLIGCVSFGLKDVCYTHAPKAATRISSFKDWIGKHMSTECLFEI